MLVLSNYIIKSNTLLSKYTKLYNNVRFMHINNIVEALAKNIHPKNPSSSPASVSKFDSQSSVGSIPEKEKLPEAGNSVHKSSKNIQGMSQGEEVKNFTQITEVPYTELNNPYSDTHTITRVPISTLESQQQQQHQAVPSVKNHKTSITEALLNKEVKKVLVKNIIHAEQEHLRKRFQYQNDIIDKLRMQKLLQNETTREAGENSGELKLTKEGLELYRKHAQPPILTTEMAPIEPKVKYRLGLLKISPDSIIPNGKQMHFIVYYYNIHQKKLIAIGYFTSEFSAYKLADNQELSGNIEKKQYFKQFDSPP